MKQNFEVKSLAAFDAPQAVKMDWKRFCNLLEKLADPATPWPGQVGLVRDWYKPQLERIYDAAFNRSGDLDQLELLSGQYPSRERFVTELTLDPPNATSDLAGAPVLDEDYLTLTTIHSAKGMEWDTVYLLNVVDGSFASEFATGKAELIEEERRLLYVALTRAQNELLLLALRELTQLLDVPIGGVLLLDEAGENGQIVCEYPPQITRPSTIKTYGTMCHVAFPVFIRSPG